MTTSTPLAPGWYADPHGQPAQRWWNGSAWTDQVAPAVPVAAALDAPLPTRSARHSVARKSSRLGWIIAAIVAVVVAAVTAGTLTLYHDQSSGQDRATADSDLRNAATTVFQCFAERGDRYPAAATSSGGALHLSCGGVTETAALTGGDTASFRPSGQGFVLTVRTPSGVVASYDSASGSIVNH